MKAGVLAYTVAFAQRVNVEEAVAMAYSEDSSLRVLELDLPLLGLGNLVRGNLASKAA